MKTITNIYKSVVSMLLRFDNFMYKIGDKIF